MDPVVHGRPKEEDITGQDTINQGDDGKDAIRVRELLPSPLLAPNPDPLRTLLEQRRDSHGLWKAK